MKLHNKKAEKIRRLINENLTDEQIAQEMNLSADIIKEVRNGRTNETTPKKAPQKLPPPQSPPVRERSDSEKELMERFIDQLCLWWLAKRDKIIVE